MKRITILTMLLAMVTAVASAQHADLGLSASIGADHKINKKWSVGMETEFRSRNDFRTFDQWNISLEAGYKPLKWLKFTGGYEFKYCNFKEKINYHQDGSLNNWRPSYCQGMHRLFLSVSGSVDIGRFDFSLRERYQYSHRASSTRQRYDFDDAMWSDKVIDAKNSNVLRSRLKIGYNIPKSKVDPYISAELFSSKKLDKIRYVAGVEWKLRKTHVFNLFYRYEDAITQDPDASNEQLIGAGYTFKF